MKLKWTKLARMANLESLTGAKTMATTQVSAILMLVSLGIKLQINLGNRQRRPRLNA